MQSLPVFCIFRLEELLRLCYTLLREFTSLLFIIFILEVYYETSVRKS
jgi:hypothetical protein